ncbi:MAG: hypothetical protein ACRDNZ_14955, partial [Streptosporangiaceae bacterium]
MPRTVAKSAASYQGASEGVVGDGVASGRLAVGRLGVRRFDVGSGSRGWPARAWMLAAMVSVILRRHRLAAVLLTAGLLLRVAAQVSYGPALLYIDSVKYLYGAWPDADPLGYDLPLKLILAVGDLGTVEAVQHVLI